MWVTFFMGFFVMLLAWLAGRLNNIKYFFVSFAIIFIYLALRFDFGSDYETYYDLFFSIKASSWDELVLLANINQFGETMEFGYIYLNKFFTLFTNFYFFIAFHSFLFCGVYYTIIKRYVDPQYYWIALFILIFHTSLMVRSISGLRQGLAVYCFIYSFQYLIEKRNIWKYVICILVAALFHYSAIILLPLYFLFNQSKVKRIEPIFYLLLYIFFVFFGEKLKNPIESITSTLLPKYMYYIDNEEGIKLGSGMGLLLSSFFYLYILFFAKRETNADFVFYRIVSVFIILSPISLVINNLSRLSLYFAPALIIVIPQLITLKQDKLLKRGFIILYILFTIYGAYGHYTSPIFMEENYNYKTILSLY